MKNKSFILTPIENILEEAVQATSSISDGIETYPLCEYLMQTVFLKMTGFQEQKLKCICWEMAEVDFDFRYELLRDGIQGEFSDYKSKNKVLNQMISMILNDEKNFTVTEQEKRKILFETISVINTIFNGSNLLLMNEKQFKYYVIDHRFTVDSFLLINQKHYQLFNDEFKTEYSEKLYRFRNRCAHNLLSYQKNLPVFEKLLEDDTSNNYFTWFKMLVITDKIITSLFIKIMELKEEFV